MESGKGFFVGRGTGRPTRVPHPTTHFKATAADTGHAYTFAEHRLALDFPLHVHHREDEGIYVVEGAMVAVVGDDTFELGQGDFVFMPRGVPHALTNRSAEPARFVFVSTPGGFEHLLDDFEEAAGSSHFPGSPEWAQIEERHGLNFL